MLCDDSISETAEELHHQPRREQADLLGTSGCFEMVGELEPLGYLETLSSLAKSGHPETQIRQEATEQTYQRGSDRLPQNGVLTPQSDHVELLPANPTGGRPALARDRSAQREIVIQEWEALVRVDCMTPSPHKKPGG